MPVCPSSRSFHPALEAYLRSFGWKEPLDLALLHPSLDTLLALSFAESPTYNGFVLAPVMEKTPSTYAADSGSGWVGKRSFGTEIQIYGDDEEKSVKRPPIYTLSLPSLSNYLDIILLCPSAFVGYPRPASTRFRHYLSPQPNYFRRTSKMSRIIRKIVVKVIIIIRVCKRMSIEMCEQARLYTANLD